jgi:hypothetical protein
VGGTWATATPAAIITPTPALIHIHGFIVSFLRIWRIWLRSLTDTQRRMAFPW